MDQEKKRFFTRHRQAGFTLVELMVVIVILGILATLVGQNVIQYIAKAKVTQAKTQMAIFKRAIKQYKIDTSQYPDNSIGLEALVSEPPGVTSWDTNGYLEDGVVPKDPWGNDYVYYYSGDPQKPFDIYSYGADGKEGGEGEDADIYSSEVSETGTQTQEP